MVDTICRRLWKPLTVSISAAIQRVYILSTAKSITSRFKPNQPGEAEIWNDARLIETYRNCSYNASWKRSAICARQAICNIPQNWVLGSSDITGCNRMQEDSFQSLFIEWFQQCFYTVGLFLRCATSLPGYCHLQKDGSNTALQLYA